MTPGRIHRAASRLLAPFGVPFEAWANTRPLKSAECGNEPRILFILGAPRSGTTLLFQSITHALAVSFPNHIAALFPTAPSFGLWLGEAISRRRPHRSFQSVHGYSTGDGLRGPNEWEQFIRYRVWDAVTTRHGTADAIDVLQKVATVSSLRTQMPLCVKNLNAVLRLEALSHAFPQSKFLAIERDDEEVVRSILKAKRREKKPANVPWYISPPELIGVDFACEEDLTIAQVNAIMNRISQAELELPPTRIMRTQYCDLCENPHSVVSEIRDWLDWDIESREGAALPASFCRSGG